MYQLCQGQHSHLNIKQSPRSLEMSRSFTLPINSAALSCFSQWFPEEQCKQSPSRSCTLSVAEEFLPIKVVAFDFNRFRCWFKWKSLLPENIIWNTTSWKAGGMSGGGGGGADTGIPGVFPGTNLRKPWTSFSDNGQTQAHTCLFQHICDSPLWRSVLPLPQSDESRACDQQSWLLPFSLRNRIPALFVATALTKVVSAKGMSHGNSRAGGSPASQKVWENQLLCHPPGATVSSNPCSRIQAQQAVCAPRVAVKLTLCSSRQSRAEVTFETLPTPQKYGPISYGLVGCPKAQGMAQRDELGPKGSPWEKINREKWVTLLACRSPDHNTMLTWRMEANTSSFGPWRTWKTQASLWAAKEKRNVPLPAGEKRGRRKDTLEEGRRKSTGEEQFSFPVLFLLCFSSAKLKKESARTLSCVT